MNIDISKFSPLRAVLFWKNDPDSHLVKIGMKIYVYNPLKIPYPTDIDSYRKDARVVYDYSTMRSPWTLSELINYLLYKDNDSGGYNSVVRPGHYQWKDASVYYSKVIEKMAAVKSVEMSSNVFESKDFDSIVPRQPADIKELKYRDHSIEILHDIVFKRMHENPIGLLRALSTFMKNKTEGSNLYACTFFHNVAKACKSSFTVKLKLKTSPVMEGICFGSNNMEVRKIMNLYTLQFCPWCYKPINVAVKKKSSAGGAHKSQIFTDEYTQEPLYCVEKNKRGIIKLPLLTCDEYGKLFSNTVEWELTRGFTRVFTIKTTQNNAMLVITNKQKGVETYSPVVSEVKCGDYVDDVEHMCLVCASKNNKYINKTYHESKQR